MFKKVTVSLWYFYWPTYFAQRPFINTKPQLHHFSLFISDKSTKPFFFEKREKQKQKKLNLFIKLHSLTENWDFKRIFRPLFGAIYVIFPRFIPAHLSIGQ